MALNARDIVRKAFEDNQAVRKDELFEKLELARQSGKAMFAGYAAEMAKFLNENQNDVGGEPVYPTIVQY